MKTKANIIIDNEIKRVACIGYFDAIHRGHQELIKRTIKIAKKYGVKATLIMFKPNPIEVINGKKISNLFSHEDRIKLIKDLGIEEIIEIKFDEAMMKTSANEFIKNYLNKLNIIELVCGFDYSFGYKAKGNVDTLKQKGNFKVNVVDKITYRKQKVSTTNIKNALLKGDLKLANRLLGYNYYLVIKVLNISKNGSKWLVEARTKNNNILLPSESISNDSFMIKNNMIYIKTNKEIDIGSIIYIYFN